ncbi:4-hydroxy-tetrahydrodipicolinate reductase [Salix suchowensis]|nr:4-hydroxy-tetrahydrodipicolinate reductase [Salix suchowensis]
MEKMLEAKKDGLEQKQEEKTLAIWDLGSPLYDSYEVVALTHLIERQLMTLPYLGGSERLSSKMFSSACDDHAVALAALLEPDMGSRKRARSSTFSSLIEFARRQLRKRRSWIGSNNREGKSKKLKAGHCGFSL